MSLQFLLSLSKIQRFEVRFLEEIVSNYISLTHFLKPKHTNTADVVIHQYGQTFTHNAVM